MNAIVTSSGSNSVAGLPLPPKEKVARWAAHIGLGVLGIGAIIKFMPFINQAINLVTTGVFSLLELGAVVFGGALLVIAIMTIWPLYKKLIESLANKATWALFEYDPITPMQLWLKDVRRDRDELTAQYEEVQGAIARNEQAVADDLAAAKKADEKFAYAVHEHGENSSEAQLMSLEPGTLRDTAESIKQNTQPLYIIRDTLKEVVDATAFTEKKAELDVKAMVQQFATYQNVTHATDAANRVLKTRTTRKQDAQQAMELIHNKYATSFGRLQGLRDLSRDVITSVDIQKGTYHQEALERLRSESRLITGTTKTNSLVLDAVPVSTDKAGVTLYKVPLA